MAAPEVVYCDDDSCKFNDSGECECEELCITDEAACASHESRLRG